MNGVDNFVELHKDQSPHWRNGKEEPASKYHRMGKSFCQIGKNKKCDEFRTLCMD